MSMGVHPGRAPEAGWRVVAGAALPVLARLSLLLILGAGILVIGCIAVTAACHAAGHLAPRAVGSACGVGLWLYVSGMGGFALVLAADILVDRR